jgi:hypothetical protein
MIKSLIMTRYIFIRDFKGLIGLLEVKNFQTCELLFYIISKMDLRLFN